MSYSLCAYRVKKRQKSLNQTGLEHQKCTKYKCSLDMDVEKTADSFVLTINDTRTNTVIIGTLGQL